MNSERDRATSESSGGGPVRPGAGPALLLIPIGAVLLIFFLFEVAERFWLQGVDMGRLHDIHRTRRNFIGDMNGQFSIFANRGA